jgi:peptide/nickel transport system substrate-binding protein
MNPYSPSVDNISLLVWDSFWEYLVQPSPTGQTFQPMLATSWTISPNRKTYTFALRPGVKFSDGTPMTTQDVLYSLHNAFTQTGSQLTFLGKMVQSVTAPDAHTIVVRMKVPWAYLLADLSGFNTAILPAKLIASEGMKSFLAHPIGTGPFKLASVSPGSSVTVVKNPYYWQPGKPYLNQITFNTVSSDIARANAVQGDTAQLAIAPPGNQVATLKSATGEKVYEFPYSEAQVLLLNTKVPPLNNQLVREAISFAMDRAGIVKTGLFGLGTPAPTFIVGPPAETNQDTALNLYSFDLSKARALMKQSGVKTPITLPLVVYNGSAESAIGTIAQADLAKIGINAKVTEEDYNTAASAMSAGHYTMLSNNWDDYVGDASEQPLFWTDPAFCCASYFTNYANPQQIALVHRAVAATAPAQVKALYDQVQRSVAVTDQVIPLYYPTSVFVASSKLTGFTANPFGTWSYPDMALSK